MPRVFLLVLLLSAACNTAEKQESAPGQGPQEFSLADLQFIDLEGNSLSGKVLLGKPTVVHFWATWCGPCIKEMPDLARLIPAYPGVQFVFPSDEDIKDIERFRDSKSFPFQYLHFPSGTYSVGITALPTTFLFDKEGKLIKKITGALDWDSEANRKLLDSL